MEVVLTLVGTPRWANGGKGPNVMPKRVADFTAFARGDRVPLLRPPRRLPLRPLLDGLERAEPPALPQAAVRRSRQVGGAEELRAAVRRRLRGDQGRQPSLARRDGRDVGPRDRQPEGRPPGALTGQVRRGARQGQPSPPVRRLVAPSISVHTEPEAVTEGALAQRHAGLAPDPRGEAQDALQAQVRPDLGHRVRARDEAAGRVRHLVREAGGVRQAVDRDREELSVRDHVRLVRLPGRSRPALGLGPVHAGRHREGKLTAEVRERGEAAGRAQRRPPAADRHHDAARDAVHAALLRRRRAGGQHRRRLERLRRPGRQRECSAPGELHDQRAA